MKDATKLNVIALIILCYYLAVLISLMPLIHIGTIPDFYNVVFASMIILMLTYVLHPRVKHYNNALAKVITDFENSYHYDKEVD
ncbi:MAG: hypothetical protein ACFFF4_09980 [Candidatus Thorarchaeota archaeon]